MTNFERSYGRRESLPFPTHESVLLLHPLVPNFFFRVNFSQGEVCALVGVLVSRQEIKVDIKADAFSSFSFWR